MFVATMTIHRGKWFCYLFLLSVPRTFDDYCRCKTSYCCVRHRSCFTFNHVGDSKPIKVLSQMVADVS